MYTKETQLPADPSEDEFSSSPVRYRIYSIEQAYRHITQPRSQQDQLLYMIVDDVLFNVWDALCLSIDENNREEYLPYLPHVFELIRTTKDGLDLYDYLVFVEETKYSLFKNDALAKRNASRVVDLLLEYRQIIFSS